MILEVKDLYFTYPDGDARKVILNEVNVAFEKGKFYTILGESGSGKTTFLSLIAALDKPERGEILYDGFIKDKLDIDEITNKEIIFDIGNVKVVGQTYAQRFKDAFDNTLKAFLG